MRTYQYITLIIKNLDDLVEFLYSGHYLVVIAGLGVSVKSLGRIPDQCMEKYMCDLLQRIFYQSRPGNLTFGCQIHIILIGIKILLSLQKNNRIVIIILCIHSLCLCQHIVCIFAVCSICIIICISILCLPFILRS